MRVVAGIGRDDGEEIIFVIRTGPRDRDGCIERSGGGRVECGGGGREVVGYRTRGGTSGSPVWYVDNGALVVVGVHVSGFDKHTNRGCRLTDAKIDWIRSI